jgi:hypothetical protein
MPEPTRRASTGRGADTADRLQGSVGRAATAMYRCGVPMTRAEAAAVAAAALPLYRDGRCTWQALTAACRTLYTGYDTYRPDTKAHLLTEARRVLRAAEPPQQQEPSADPAGGWDLDRLRAHAAHLDRQLQHLEDEHHRIGDRAIGRYREHLAAGRDHHTAATHALAHIQPAGTTPPPTAPPRPAQPAGDISAAPATARELLEDIAAAEHAITTLTGTHARTAQDAIGLFLEYRDRHGHHDDSAHQHASQEVHDGTHAVRDIAHDEPASRRNMHNPAAAATPTARPAEPAQPEQAHDTTPPPAADTSDRERAESAANPPPALPPAAATPTTRPAEPAQTEQAHDTTPPPPTPPPATLPPVVPSPAAGPAADVRACAAAVHRAQQAVDHAEHARQHADQHRAAEQARAEQLTRWHSTDQIPHPTPAAVAEPGLDTGGPA